MEGEKDGGDSFHSRFSGYAAQVALAMSETIPKRASIETARVVLATSDEKTAIYTIFVDCRIINVFLKRNTLNSAFFCFCSPVAKVFILTSTPKWTSFPTPPRPHNRCCWNTARTLSALISTCKGSLLFSLWGHTCFAYMASQSSRKSVCPLKTAFDQDGGVSRLLCLSPVESTTKWTFTN